MKNINYIINGILAAAVIVLFVLHFTGNSGNGSDTHMAAKRDSLSGAGVSVAYFKVDSILTNWNLYFAMQEELATKQQQLETDLDRKTETFRKRVEDAQYKIQRGLVTRAEAEELQQQLALEEQNLVGLQNNYSMQMQEEGLVKNRQMIDKIEQFLKKYNEDKGYTYIFSYTFGGNLFYGNEAYDITSDIIKGINEEYPVEK